MKYDDASWHYDGEFPKGLPPEAGATHIGLFLAWMLINGLASEELIEDSEEELGAVKNREVTGAQFLMQTLDEKLSDTDFSDEGNAFANAYYQGRNNDSLYLDDYFEILEVDEKSFYGSPDNWQNYDKLAVRMADRFAQWNAQGKPKYLK